MMVPFGHINTLFRTVVGDAKEILRDRSFEDILPSKFTVCFCGLLAGFTFEVLVALLLILVLDRFSVSFGIASSFDVFSYVSLACFERPLVLMLVSIWIPFGDACD